MINPNLTPKELMISRYEAFANENWEYLVQTSTHQTLSDLEQSPPIQWLKLDVLDSYENIVEFKAYYKLNGAIEVLHEKSSFVQENGVWKYDDGVLYDSKILRNDTCPCGSGKKFKKCCA